MTKYECATCKFMFERADKSAPPECRRYPPTSILIEQTSEDGNKTIKTLPSFFPAMKSRLGSEDWCGEYFPEKGMV